MIHFIPDCSIALKWFSPTKEELLDEAKKIFNDAFEYKIRLIAPELLFYETSNALCYSKHFSAAEICEALEKMQHINIDLASLDAEIEARIVQLMEKYKLTAYDAGYLALAEISGAKLITCDKDLLAVESQYVLHLKDY